LRRCFKPTVWDGDPVMAICTLLKGTCSKPTAWDGDSSHTVIGGNSCPSVPSPPCGMVTHERFFLWHHSTTVPSPPCGMVISLLSNVFSFMTTVPSPPCGMVTIHMGCPAISEPQVPSPPCGMVTSLQLHWQHPLHSCSKPTVWDGDINRVLSTSS